MSEKDGVIHEQPWSLCFCATKKKVQVTTLTTHSADIGVAKTSDTNDDNSVDTFTHYKGGNKSSNKSF